MGANFLPTKKPTALLICGEGGHFEQARIFLGLAAKQLCCTLVTEKSVTVPSNVSVRIITLPQVSNHTKHKKLSDYLPFISKFFVIVFYSMFIIIREKPKYIINFGPIIGLPFLVMGKILRIKLVHIETRSRFETLSTTGKYAVDLSDFIFVQNKSLLKLSEKFHYVGRLEN